MDFLTKRSGSKRPTNSYDLRINRKKITLVLNLPTLFKCVCQALFRDSPESRKISRIIIAQMVTEGDDNK